MLTALLLPLFLLGAPDGAAADGARQSGSDEPAIQIWINNNRRFLPGDRGKVEVRAREDGYLLVLHADPDGHLRVMFPLDPKDDSFVRGGRKYEIRGRGGREAFTADDGKGRGTVYAAVSHDPFRLDPFVLGDHWDYRQLSPQRLPADPEQDLNELVRRMVNGGFDYDLLTYDVLERVVYAGSYGGTAYDSYGCGYSYYGCGSTYYDSPSSLSIGLFFGRPYHRRSYFYDPFYAAYNPFYDPFFYDPYYYRPAYVYPVGGYGYGNPYYNYPYRGYYTNRYGGWDRPYAPYRSRPADGSNAGYRDRRYALGRSVNTVYLPPRVRGAAPATANPIRRVTAEGVGVDSRPGSGRRASAPIGSATTRRPAERAQPERTPGRAAPTRGDSRLTRPNIEARRAREPEERTVSVPDSRDARDLRDSPRARSDLPTEVRPEPVRSDAGPRRAVGRPDDARDANRRPMEARAEERPDPRVVGEPRRAEPAPSDPPPQAPPQTRSNDHGGERGSYSPPARSDGGSYPGGVGGGDRGGGRGAPSGGGDLGGGRRR